MTKSRNTKPAPNAVRKPATAPSPGIGLSLPADPPAGEAPERLRQSAAPVCPNCKGADGQPNTVCVSQGSRPFFTIYVCPNKCGFRLKQPKPRMQERLARAAGQEPAVKRP